MCTGTRILGDQNTQRYSSIACSSKILISIACDKLMSLEMKLGNQHNFVMSSPSAFVFVRSSNCRCWDHRESMVRMLCYSSIFDGDVRSLFAVVHDFVFSLTCTHRGKSANKTI